MNRDRQTILSLVAMGRITAAEAERLLAAWSESRDTAWIVALCLAFACLAQIHLREILPMLMHLCSASIPAMFEGVHHALAPITGLWGGSL
jgi:hypothetical protein